MATKVNTPSQKKKVFLSEYLKNNCNVSAAAEATGINRVTYYKWLKTDAKFAEQIQETTEHLYDEVEKALLQRIKEKDTTAIIFFCKTKMKNRGYVEKQQLDVKADVTEKILTIDPFSTNAPD